MPHHQILYFSYLIGIYISEYIDGFSNFQQNAQKNHQNVL